MFSLEMVDSLLFLIIHQEIHKMVLDLTAKGVVESRIAQ